MVVFWPKAERLESIRNYAILTSQWSEGVMILVRFYSVDLVLH
jgi:hypothetical protein